MPILCYFYQISQRIVKIHSYKFAISLFDLLSKSSCDHILENFSKNKMYETGCDLKCVIIMNLSSNFNR